jgi:hypothetical protein
MKSQLAFCQVSILSIALTTATVSPAQGVQIMFNNTSNVTKIENLVIDDVTYDVNFQSETFVNLFGNPNDASFNRPTFWNNPQGATRAVETIASLLNSQQPVPQTINKSSSALVPYRGIIASNESLFIANKIDDYITRWSTLKGESEDIFVQGNEQANYALFTAKQSQPVPENNLPLAVVGIPFFIGIKLLKRRFYKFHKR